MIMYVIIYVFDLTIFLFVAKSNVSTFFTSLFSVAFMKTHFGNPFWIHLVFA